MYSYYLSSEAKEDLKRIYYYGVGKFGMDQADHYFGVDTFFATKSLGSIYRM